MKSALSALFLLPAFLCIRYAVAKRLDKAFLWIYLPCLLMLPDYYVYRLPHLPQISAAQAALLPLGLTVLFQSFSRWKFARMDLWVVLFMGSIAASEIFRENDPKDGLFLAIISFITVVLAYVVGRQLIEPDLRLETAKRFVIMLMLLAPLGAYEMRMGSSLYTMAGVRIFGLEMLPWSVQFRGGHVRLAMSLSDAELGGIVFATTLFLNTWLVRVDKNDRLSGQAPRLGYRLQKLEKYHIPGLMLLGFLLLTRSRGPILAAALGAVILQIPRFKNVRRVSIIVGIVLVLGISSAYLYFQKYTQVSDTSSASEEQQSAMYRRQLLENYKPVLEQGGWLGWGVLSYPVFPGQRSIDNEYLLVQITQGRLGFYLLVIITAESLWHLIVCTWRFQNREDMAFAFTLLATLSMMWITYTTVFMGEQLPQITFMLLGWSQSLRDNTSRVGATAGAQDASLTKFGFKRVFS
jgi:O-Antigen ligase